MAKVTPNPAIAGISGKVGNYIFRQQHGQTIVLGDYETKQKWTKAQRAERHRFGDAQAYASAVLADPLKREGYLELAAARKKPVNALIASNYLKPPVVTRVELSEFRGKAKDVIRALATDGIEVVGVTFTAFAADGEVLESGAALKDHGVWVYQCTTALGDKAKKLEVTATNRAGRTGTQVVSLSGG